MNNKVKELVVIHYLKGKMIYFVRTILQADSMSSN